MTTNIVATITGNGAALTAEINKTFGSIPGIAKNVGKELGNLFDTEFKKGAREAETVARASARSISEIVKSATVTNGAIQFDSSGIKATIAARQQELQVMEALLAAKQRLTAKESDASRGTQVYLATLQQSVNEERQAIAALTSKAQVLDNLQNELGQTAVQQSKVNAVSGQARAGMQQLSFQVNDVATSFAGGISPMVIFAQQGSQIVQALGAMSNGSNRFLAVMGNPWTSVLFAAVTVVGSLASSLFSSSKEADAAAGAHETLTQKLDLQRHSLDEVIKASREYNAEQGRSTSITLDAAAAVAVQTKKNIEAAISIRQKLAAELAAANQTATNSAGQGFGGATSAAVGKAAGIEARLAENAAQLRDLSQTARNNVIDIASEMAKINSDPRYKISAQFDRMRASAKRSIKDVEDLAKALADLNRKEASALEAQSKLQRDANRETERLPSVTGQEVAKLLGTTITSGKRSASQNKKAGGAANSYHLIDQAIDIPLTVNGRPLTKEGIRAALEPAGIVIKELLGPGDKGHDDHFHVAFARKRAASDKIAADAAAEAKKAQDALAASLSNVIQMFDPAAQAAAEYRNRLREINELASVGVAGGGISAEDAKRYRDDLAESHAAKLDAIEDARHAKFLGNMSQEFQLAGELSGDVAAKMVSDYLDTVQAAEEQINQKRQDDADRQREEYLDLANFYERAFESGGRSIWSTFKQMGRRVLAELAAQATISLLGSGNQGGIGGFFSNIFGNGTSGISSVLGGGAGGGSALAGLSSAAGPAAALVAVNQGVAKALGNDQIKNGMLSSLIIGPILTKLFGSAKRGSATLAFTNGELGVGATRGNSGSRISAAKDGIGSLADTLNQIAEALGGTISGAGSVSLGIRKKTYVVDPTGQGRTKGAGVLKFKDEQDAIEAAMRDALQDGVIDGISAASKKILASGQDLQKAIQKASLIESIPKALKARLNPVGAALDELNEKWDKTIAALKEGGATAEQMAEAEKLYRLERQDALTAANDNLKEFINSLNFGSSSTYSLVDQSKAARAELDQYLGKINSGNFAEVDQQKYLAAAQAFLEIQRELGGSGTGWFNSVDELRTATQRLADGLAQGTNSAAGARDPFAELTATSTQATAEILAQHSGLLAAQSQSLNMIQQYLATMAGGNGFIGTNRNFLAAAV